VDRESPELIERQMEETRESLTEKVSQLEQQVVGTIQSATSAVQGTVESVRSAVQETVEAVTGTVKNSVESMSAGMREALDVPRHVRRHPWEMVGGAAALGFVTGLLVLRPHSAAVPAPAFTPRASTDGPPPALPRRPAWLDEIVELAGREIKQLARQAFATASASLRQSVEEGIPKLVHRALPEMESAPGDRERYAGNGRSPYADMGDL
jgi:ElaB/YqjD/DUF883 family membrane-anchored ribosome-binding protein